MVGPGVLLHHPEPTQLVLEAVAATLAAGQAGREHHPVICQRRGRTAEPVHHGTEGGQHDRAGDPVVRGHRQGEPGVVIEAGQDLHVGARGAVGDLGTLPVDGPGSAVIRQRLERLPSAARRTAELVALAHPAPVALFDEDSQALATLQRDGIVVTHGDGRARLDHPLQAEWLVQELGSERPARFAELARRTRGRTDIVDPLVVVEWQLASGRGLDPQAAASAVRLALARTDARAARRLVDHVVDEHDLLLGRLMRSRATSSGPPICWSWPGRRLSARTSAWRRPPSWCDTLG